MDIFLSILITILVFCAIFAVRNQIVYSCQMMALDYTSKLMSMDIDTGQDWRQRFYHYESCGSYYQMLFDLTKWTYKQFYPDYD